MSEDQIKHMVGRFLGWRLPENFSPDGGISFEMWGNKGTPHQYKREPSGTNLLDAVQAEAMVRYMIDGVATSGPAGVNASLLSALKEAQPFVANERDMLLERGWLPRKSVEHAEAVLARIDAAIASAEGNR